jgi:hypothetical protein
MTDSPDVDALQKLRIAGMAVSSGRFHSVERDGHRVWVSADGKATVAGRGDDPGGVLMAEIIGLLEGADAKERFIAQRPPDDWHEQAEALCREQGK